MALLVSGVKSYLVDICYMEYLFSLLGTEAACTESPSCQNSGFQVEKSWHSSHLPNDHPRAFSKHVHH